jgi:transcriptional regulator with XRE-family HTH domain
MLPEHEIGKNIRMIRKLKELTLKDLAGKTGFTKGYLSKVENSEKAPPVSTLLNIARAMDVNMSALFGEGHEPTSFSLVKKSERLQMARNGSAFGYSYETLAHKYPDKKMAPYILTIPYEIEESPMFQHQGEELLFVLQGTVRFLHGENEYLLEKDDCIYFDSGIGHHGFALGGREAEVLIVMLSS